MRAPAARARRREHCMLAATISCTTRLSQGERACGLTVAGWLQPRPLVRKGEGSRPIRIGLIPSPFSPKLPRIKFGVAKAQSPLPLGEEEGRAALGNVHA